MAALWGGLPSAQPAPAGQDINERFRSTDLDTAAVAARFESAEREAFARRHDVVAALGLGPGMAVADIGAGSGFYAALMAAVVGPDGDRLRRRDRAQLDRVPDREGRGRGAGQRARGARHRRVRRAAGGIRRPRVLVRHVPSFRGSAGDPRQHLPGAEAGRPLGGAGLRPDSRRDAARPHGASARRQGGGGRGDPVRGLHARARGRPRPRGQLPGDIRPARGRGACAGIGRGVVRGRPAHRRQRGRRRSSAPRSSSRTASSPGWGARASASLRRAPRAWT